MMAEPKNTKSKQKESDTLIDALRDSDDFTRSKIIEQLVSSPTKSMIEQVVYLLDEKNTSVRMDVLELLKKTGNHNIDAVIQLLYHSNEDIRVYGCEVLSDLKNRASLPHLIQKVNEDSENVRNAAVVALGEFDDQRAIDVLLEMLDQEEWVAFSAIYSLAKMGNKRVVPALLDVFKNREEELSLAACETLITFRDDKTIDEVVDFVGQLEKHKKGTFVRVIIEQGDNTVFLKLLNQMGDELLSHVLSYLKVQKRKALYVVKFLVHFKNKLSVQAMLDILKDLDQDGEDFDRVMRFFIELRDVWEEHLEEYLSVEEYGFSIIRACGNVGCQIDENLLLKVFCVSSLETKREIMKQLGRIANGHGYKVIREAMNDIDGHVQADAVAIAGSLLLTELTSDVLIMAKNGFPDVRGKALLALLRLDMKMAMAAIDWFVKEGSSEDKRVYLSIAPHIDVDINYTFLKHLLADSDERIRQMAIRIVGNSLDNEKYLDLFELVLKSGSIPNEVLKLIGEKRLVGFKKLLLDLVLDPLQAVWTRYHALIALGVFGDKSLFPIFSNALKENDNLIKIGGLKALSELKDPRAIPRIRPYTKSTDEDVKTAAMMALGKLSRSEAVC
jgi:HEAT repeat protein